MPTTLGPVPDPRPRTRFARRGGAPVLPNWLTASYGDSPQLTTVKMLGQFSHALRATPASPAHALGGSDESGGRAETRRVPYSLDRAAREPRHELCGFMRLPSMHNDTPVPSTMSISDPVAWWRRICPIPGTRLFLSGDLPDSAGERADHLQQWVEAGITDIIDVRIEWSDEVSVRELQPQLRYHWLGADDHDDDQEDEWFAEGVGAALEAFCDPTAKVMVHCHMGVNRGPSMAFATLVAMGWEPVHALEAIRNARPIAAAIYADQGLDWWHRQTDTDRDRASRQQSELAEWMGANRVDTGFVISRICRAEAA